MFGVIGFMLKFDGRQVSDSAVCAPGNSGIMDLEWIYY